MLSVKLMNYKSYKQKSINMINTSQNAKELLKELNLDKLPPSKRDKVLAQIEEHFTNVVVSTLLNQLSEEQFEQFKKALASDKQEEEIAALAVQVPGLAEILEERIKSEYELMRSVMKLK
jgi:16S rRNA C967 or C1407 C5-methylase (RsmB/RsmF family)